MKEIRNKKILNSIIGFMLFLAILISGFWLINNMFTVKVKAQENENVVNLASPNLTGKEYLGDGVYRLQEQNGGTLIYNVYSGEYRLFGNLTGQLSYNFGYDRPSADNAYIQMWKTKEVVWTNGGAINGFGGSNPVSVEITKSKNYDSKIAETSALMRIYTYNILGEIDVYFKMQLEKGITATDYQVPIEALEQHEQFIYDSGFDIGYILGNSDGYEDGFDDGLDEVFNTNNLMPIAEVRDRGTYGPVTNFFAFTIPINKKVNSITILNLVEYPLKPIDWMSINGNMKQGFNVGYDDGQQFYSFSSQGIDEFSDMIYIELNENKFVEYITLALALDNPSFPNTDYDNMIEHMKKNLGFYVNNKILNDNAIVKFKEIIELEVKRDLELEYKPKLENEYKKGKDDGYDLGLIDNPNNNFGSMITTILLGVGTVLGIELLPNITIGAIIAVPIVFGIIAFVLGRKKE